MKPLRQFGPIDDQRPKDRRDTVLVLEVITAIAFIGFVIVFIGMPYVSR